MKNKYTILVSAILIVISALSLKAEEVKKSVILHKQKELVTKVIGMVSDQVITSREVQIFYVIEKALYGNEKNEIALLINSPEFAGAANECMLEWIVKLEAEGFSAANVSPEELAKNQERLNKVVQESKFWKSLEVGTAELQSAISRKLVAKNFIKFKTEATGVTVTDVEAREYYEKNRLKFGNVPYSDMRENIKNFLAKQAMQSRLRDWFELLKRKYKVRNYLTES